MRDVSYVLFGYLLGSVLFARIAGRIFCGGDEKRSFWLYQGGETSLAIGELYGFQDGTACAKATVSGVELSAEDREKLGEALAALHEKEAAALETAALPELRLTFDNGLIVRLRFDQKNQVLVLFDRSYPAGSAIVEILEHYL